MATLPLITDVYRVQMHWSDSSGQTAVNVVHFHRTGSTAAVVAAAIDANVTSSMWAAVAASAHVDRLNVTPLDGSSATYLLATSGAKWTGSASADLIPASSCIVSLRTALRGKSNRGRIYLPFLTEGQQSGGVVLSTAVSAMQTAWNTFLGAMVTATQLLVVASYKHAAYHEVTSLLVESFAATQRRRQSRLRV